MTYDAADRALAGIVVEAHAVRPGWMRWAACRDPDLAEHFWRSADNDDHRTRALATCRQCPTRNACAAYADTMPRSGIVIAGRPPRRRKRRRRPEVAA